MKNDSTKTELREHFGKVQVYLIDIKATSLLDTTPFD